MKHSLCLAAIALLAAGYSSQTSDRTATTDSLVGPAGPTRAQGPVGPTGAAGTYMVRNPSLRLGIDGAADSQATDSRNPDHTNRRVSAVRDALIHAGTRVQNRDGRLRRSSARA